MTHSSKGSFGAAHGKPLAITTFKNSLRSWQAQWKAQKAAAATREEDKSGRRPGA